MIRKSKLRKGAVATFAAMALTLTACAGSEQAGGDGKTVKLAFVGPLTGDSANLGINIRNGAKVAVQEANEGNPDVKVELVEFDTQGDPAQATTVAQRFLTDESVIGVVGPTFSGETKALLPQFQQANLVNISASATNAGLPTSTPNLTVFHRVIPDDDVQGKGVTDYIVKALGAKRVAYVHDNSDYGKGLVEGTTKTVSAAGATTALTGVLDPKSQDFSAAVNQVKGANADVVFYGGYYTEAGRFAKQLKDAGVNAQFLSADGALDPGFISAAGTQANGAQLTCPCNLATESAPGKLGEFARKYKTVNNSDPGTYSSEGYDAASILIAGIKAGNTDRVKLLNYVETMPPFDGISKRIEFEPNGNVKSSDVFFFEVRDNKITLLGSNATLIK